MSVGQGATVLLWPFLGCSAVFAMLCALHLVYRSIRVDPFLSVITGAIAILCWCGMMGGVIGVTALRTGAPLIDAALARADAAIGMDTRHFVEWVAHYPEVGWLLALAYQSSSALIFLAVVGLSWAGRFDRVWELCFVFCGTLTAGVLISAMFPALGAFPYYGTPAAVLEALPVGSGVYHLAKFNAYRSGAVSTIDFLQLNGVLTFPSFHTCMALMTAFAFRGMRALGWAMVGWNALVVISTVPIGGHYMIDLLAGGALWALFVAVLRPAQYRQRGGAAVLTRPLGLRTGLDPAE
jgi:membrane-associated phospholipid phosphatase